MMRRSAGLLALLVCAACCDDSRSEIARRVSPDGRHVATLYATSYGATASGPTVLSLQRNGSGPSKSRDVYSVMGNLWGRIEWKSNTELVYVFTDGPLADELVYLPESDGVSFTVDYQAPRPMLFSVPEGFSGPAVVVFGDPSARPLALGRTLRCRIGEDGLLRTSEPYPVDPLPPEFAIGFAPDAWRPLYGKESSVADEIQVLATGLEAAHGRMAFGFLVGLPADLPRPEETLRRSVLRALGL